MERSTAILLLFASTLAALIRVSHADLAHFFTPEFGYFQQQHQPHNHHHQQQQYPFHVGLQPPPPQPSLPSLYGAPPPQQQAPGYPSGPPSAPAPAPVAPIPAPVAPPPSTTTEFTLPEIIENRRLRNRHNFIPLQSEYLPPDERPNYESPKPPNTDEGHGQVYYYPRPTAPTTTTARPSPIVVLDPPDLGGHEEHGYDYNAPPPVVVVPARPSTPAPVYLPPAQNTDSSGGDETMLVEPADSGTTPLRLRVKEMRCLKQQRGYLRSVLKVESFIGATPSVDNDSSDRRCELKLSRSYVLVDIAAEDFQRCGVHTCGKDLCLRVRFPAIRGMRSGADAILTLHCKTQDRVAVKTHALKMGVANDAQSRSVGTYAHGGAQNPFRTHVELLRKSTNGYTRHLESNGAVQLGEELLLRAHVIAGDGWNYTKLTDVGLQRISPTGELLNTANLVTANGCLNPLMQSICRQPPAFEAPLGHRLSFRAIMFQGMQSGDELVMSMRITGCLEANDCQVAAHGCAFDAAGLGRQRRRREIAADGDQSSAAVGNGTEISEISRISFRVLMGDEADAPALQEEREDDARIASGIKSRTLALTGSWGFVLLVLCLVIFAAVKFRK